MRKFFHRNIQDIEYKIMYYKMIADDLFQLKQQRAAQIPITLDQVRLLQQVSTAITLLDSQRQERFQLLTMEQVFKRNNISPS